MFDPDFETQHDRSEQTSRHLRHLLIASAAVVALMGFACSASAQTTSGTVQGAADANAGAASRSGAAIYQNFQGADPNQRVTYGGGTANRTTVDGGTSDRYRATIRNTPDAFAPNVSGGTNSCLVGISGAGSVAGFGFGLGGNWSDPECERRQLAALLHNTGQDQVAQEVLCDTATVRAARQRLGVPCIQDRQQPIAPVAAPATAPVLAAAPAPRAARPAFCDTLSNAAERARYRAQCS